MAFAQDQIQDEVLNELAQKVFDEYLYMQVDTGTTMPGTSAVELINGGTQIGSTAALFNKQRNSDTTYTNITDNNIIMEVILTSGEPYYQPLNIGSFGLMSQQTSGAGLKLATTLPVTFVPTGKSF